MSRPLVIVESPAKAKTIAQFLGPDFDVEASIGHIRDLPKSAKEIPAAYKAHKWSRLGVDVENEFKPLYVVPAERKDQVKKLREIMKNASELYLATDEDREGESIAWHIVDVLSPKIPVKRMVFHEITKHAIEEAVNNWRELDRKLVDAQEARRILDRLYGYEISPVLWKKVMPKLSAGRVQSVAVRMIVERERARMKFKRAAWWDLTAEFESDNSAFKAVMQSVNGRKLATGKDFNSEAQLQKDLLLLDKEKAESLRKVLLKAQSKVSSIEKKPVKRSPAPPFMTSTLQQEAARKLKFGAAKTMKLAQSLYESGWITYMRTDSLVLSGQAINAARQLAKSIYGKEVLPDSPRAYSSKVKNAQEAHEAIRPAGETWKSLETAYSKLSKDEARLYELIWKRTLAAQMKDASGFSVTIKINAETTQSAEFLGAGPVSAEFVTSGTVITDPGFLSVYEESSDEDAGLESTGDAFLPDLNEGQVLKILSIESKDHLTSPPSRYTDASLVKAMEELGVGRPSTYANVIETILKRNYVFRKGLALVPSFIAFAVTGLLEEYFPQIVDYNFTAEMEDDLDAIANGEKQMVPYLKELYFGKNSKMGLKDLVSNHLSEIDAREVNSIVIGKDPDGTEIVVRPGRYGPFIARGDDRVSIAEDQAPDELTVEKAIELLNAPSSDRVLGLHPETKENIYVKTGRFGPYIQMGEGGGTTKPKVVALFSDMNVADVTLDEAHKLLDLPRLVGIHPDTGMEIYAQNGRYGPYLTMGKETRSLASESEIFTVTLDEAVARFREKKTYARQSSVLKELGKDPETGNVILIKNGRFGPYITDGDINASLKSNQSPNNITLEKALEMLEEKRINLPKERSSKKLKNAG
jgi:DNA topoisomerase-1